MIHPRGFDVQLVNQKQLILIHNVFCDSSVIHKREPRRRSQRAAAEGGGSRGGAQHSSQGKADGAAPESE